MWLLVSSCCCSFCCEQYTPHLSKNFAERHILELAGMMVLLFQITMIKVYLSWYESTVESINYKINLNSGAMI